MLFGSDYKEQLPNRPALATEAACEHILVSSISLKGPQHLCRLCRARTLEVAVDTVIPAIAPFFDTYMGDGVAVEFGDRFHPFAGSNQFVVTLHLNKSLVERGGARDIRVITADHMIPCILSFPFCTQLPLSPLQSLEHAASLQLSWEELERGLCWW